MTMNHFLNSSLYPVHNLFAMQVNRILLKWNLNPNDKNGNGLIIVKLPTMDH